MMLGPRSLRSVQADPRVGPAELVECQMLRLTPRCPRNLRPEFRNLKLRLSAKSHVIIEIEQVEPRLYVFAGRVELFHPVGEHFQCFHVAIRSAFGKVSAPLLDLPWTPLVRRVLLYPGQHFTIAFASGKLGH